MKKIITTAVMTALMASSVMTGAAPAMAQTREQIQAQKQAQAQAQVQSQAPARAPAQVQARPQPQAQPQQQRGPVGRGGPQGASPRYYSRGAPPQAQPTPQAQPQQQSPRNFEPRTYDGRRFQGQDPRAPNQGNAPNPGFSRNAPRNNGAGPGFRQVQPSQQQWRGARDNGRQRYDPRYYPRELNARQHFQWRGPAYRYPPGFFVRQWAFGEFLPFGWYSPDYYIDNWDWYGLEPPPIGFEWVREGRDAILVDAYTGQVYEVVYGLFW